jgi:hypothetical protein
MFWLNRMRKIQWAIDICLLQKPIYIVSKKQDGIYQELGRNMYLNTIAQTFQS